MSHPSYAEGITLRGAVFELPLPAGWEPHPGQAQMEDVGAVNHAGPFELIVTTHLVSMDEARAAGVSFEQALWRLAESRRAAMARFTATGHEIEPLQSARADGTVVVCAATLAKPPFVGATGYAALIALPAAETSKRPILTVSLYDYRGAPTVEVYALANALLGGLRFRERGS